jgi:hypothetical protein
MHSLSKACRVSHGDSRQLIESGVRGARLFRVARADGLGWYWEVELKFGAKESDRRFASELHARAWLASWGNVLLEPRSVDLEELNVRFRSLHLAR